MNRILVLLFLCLVSGVFAQELTFDENDWQDPTVFEKGQNLPHAFHIPYSSANAAIQNLPLKSKNFKLLNGQWNFKWVETPKQVPENFWGSNYDVAEWDKIMVPANWQMEGYGHPKFRNIALTFVSDAPKVPDYYNPVGCYKRKFSIPQNWNDKEIMLRFEGVKSATYVWVNGKRVGYNQGGFEPAEFNITPFLQAGENDLAVQVIRFSDGSYLENQDMWRLSGIFRDVKLYAQPKTFIHDYYVTTDLDRDYKDVTLKIETDIQNKLLAATKGSVVVNVYNTEGRSILQDGALKAAFEVDSAASEKVTFETLVVDPPKWSAEIPNLFILLFELKDSLGKTTEAFTQKLGFREVEYKKHILTVNGVPVKLNGVNSHMHHPEHGQAVPLETLKKDLLIMKQFNINCVRTCHYPPTQEYINMADELGMYIFDEVGDEAHNNIYLSGKKEWTEMYRDRSRKLVYRDRNHASVIVWSAGNESGSGFNINEVIKTGKAIDPSRPAWMYGGNKFYIPYEDLVGPRYWIPLDYKKLADGKVLPRNDMRASFMDEYLAATGNGLGGMDEYWELIWKYPRLSGGAIWDWISPGINTPRWITPDLSVAKNDGQIMGRPVLTEGKEGWGMEFSGHDDWIEFYRDPSLDITENQLAISFWVKPMEIPQPNTFITKGKYQYGIQMENPETLEFFIHSGKRISVKAKVGEDFYNNWHHIAGIYNGRQLQLYIDSKRVASTSFSGKIQSTPFPLCIGRDAETHDQGEHSGRMSKMVIDEVKVFNKAIAISDIEKSDDGKVLHLDFEEDKKQDDFYAVGIGGRTYGIIWPNREIQPEIHQIKRSGQPVAIKATDIDSGKFVVINRHHFKNLSELDGVWQLIVDGESRQRGFFDCAIAAQESGELTIDYRRPRVEEGAECLLEVSFVLKEDLQWAEKGHEIAWEQFEIPADRYFVEEEKTNNKLDFAETDKEFKVSGTNFSYVYNKEDGELKSLKFNATEYLEGGPAFNVWRAPIANDIDPWGSYFFGKDNITEGFGRSIDNQLRTLGMRDMQTELVECELISASEDVIKVKLKVFSHAVRDFNYDNTWGGASSAFERNEVWTFLPDGSIELEQEIIPHGRMPKMLQKMGLQFQLPKAFNKIQYYGRGPFENYPDRKTGAKIGLYQSTADSMFVPYIIPQEYGNRSDVRWLKVQNDDGKGLLIKGDDLLNFSLHKYSTDNLSRAMYSYQLQEAPNSILNVDYEVSGVGGTAIRQLQKYRVMPRVATYKLTIKPF